MTASPNNDFPTVVYDAIVNLELLDASDNVGRVDADGYFVAYERFNSEEKASFDDEPDDAPISLEDHTLEEWRDLFKFHGRCVWSGWNETEEIFFAVFKNKQ